MPFLGLMYMSRLAPAATDATGTRFSALTLAVADQPILALPVRTTAAILSGFRQLVKVLRTLP